MLSIGKLAPGRQQYYLDTVAAGIEDYYTGAGEAPGRLLGGASSLLGLAGEVDADDLHAVLDGRDPDSGEPLGRTPTAGRVPGFDTTFCAPKSVSILFALASPDVSAEIRAAHDAAVVAALGLLEAETCVARRSHAGAQEVTGDGFVAAGFRHRTSRAGDPHLHTHALVANLVHSPDDDRWTALHARPLYHWSKTVGYVYSAELRAELTRRLGVEWGPVVNGMADIAGVPRPLIRSLSTRRREIEAMLDANGASGGRAAQVATYATRPTKTQVNLAEKLPLWRDIARVHGLDPTTIAKLIDGTRRHGPAQPDIDRLFEFLAGPEGLTLQRSHFDRRDVIQAVAGAMPEGAHVDQIVALAEQFIDSPFAVALDLPRQLAGRVSLEAEQPGATRWTTVDMLDTERWLVRLACDGQNTRAAQLTRRDVTQALHGLEGLSPEQAAMVETICTSGNLVDVVEGAAGAGKTTAMRNARQVWEQHGFEVIGAALSARASQQLEDGSGIPSMTLDRLLGALDRPDRSRLTPRHVVVLDEAAMVGTRKLLSLVAHAQEAGAKVVLVGDYHQLPEIEAGGAFASLARRLDATPLLDNRRQQEPWERVMLTELRAGDVTGVLDTLEGHGRFHLADTPDHAMVTMVGDWLDARADGSQVLMMAQHHGEVDRLNAIARTHLQAVGEVGPDELVVGDLPFASGDKVMALRNDYRVGILNGTRATVMEINADRRVMIVNDGRADIGLPFSYLADGNLTHGYAVTVHKAQGLTVDRALVLAIGGMAREYAYTALSRGIARNDLYTSGVDTRVAERHLDETAPEPKQQIDSGLHRSAAEQLAMDQFESITGTSSAELLAAMPPPEPWPGQLPVHEVKRSTEPDVGLGL